MRWFQHCERKKDMSGVNNERNKKIRVCLVTIFSPYFLFLKTIFIFETKKLVWQPKIDKKKKKKTVLKTQFVKEIEKMQKTFFSF